MSDGQAVRPTVLQRALAIVLSIGFVAMAGLAIKDLLMPPFTAAEVRENLVDTWEAYSLGSAALLIGVGALTLFSGVVALRTHAYARRMYLYVTLLGVLTLGLMGTAWEVMPGPP